MASPFMPRLQISFLIFTASYSNHYRIRFGKPKRLISTDSTVYHIEVDLSDSRRLLFSDGHALKSTDGVIATVLVGNALQPGYREGMGEEARFFVIKDFIQLDKKTIMIVDENNDCLRLVNRNNLTTSPFIGVCTRGGQADGSRVKFSFPNTVIKDLRSSGNKLLVLDSFNLAIRQVDLLTRKAATIVDSADLWFPARIAFDREENLLITNQHYISDYNFFTGTAYVISGRTRAGNKDGTLNTARFNNPKDLISLYNGIILLADSGNHQLRLVDRANNFVYSISNSNPIIKHDNSARLTFPTSLLATDQLIYVGQRHDIMSLPCKCKIITWY